MTGIVITMGAAVGRALIDSGYASSGDRAIELHAAVREPRRRFRKGWGNMLEVEASPDCWDDFCHWVALNCGSPHGVRVVERDANDKLVALKRRVERELDRLAKHPAYGNLAVLGVSSVTLPAYKVRHTTGLRLEPTRWRIIRQNYNGSRIEAGTLVPDIFTVRGRTYTAWNFFSAERADEPEQDRPTRA